jgi:hypothetical protein
MTVHGELWRGWGGYAYCCKREDLDSDHKRIPSHRSIVDICCIVCSRDRDVVDTTIAINGLGSCGCGCGRPESIIVCQFFSSQNEKVAPTRPPHTFDFVPRRLPPALSVPVSIRRSLLVSLHLLHFQLNTRGIHFTVTTIVEFDVRLQRRQDAPSYCLAHA